MNKKTITYIIYLLVFWSAYRATVTAPEYVDELLAKPLIWITPIIILTLKRKRKLQSLGIYKTNILKNVQIGMLFSFLLFAELLLVKKATGQMILFFTPGFLPLIISFATGITEEIAFRGFIMNNLRMSMRSSTKANIATSILFIIIHLPYLLSQSSIGADQILAFLFISASLSLVEGFVFSKTNGVVAPIVSHSLWNFLNTLIV